MLAQEIAPTEIGKHANIIRVAQEELANMDVLVCGRCLRAYNFVEEFQAHKEDACEKENANLKESLDTKPTIWAFTLWKATQLHQRKETSNSNSWALYQHWVKLEESVREPWIVAGKTIQSFGKIGHGQLQDMPVRITKTVVNPNNNNNTSNSNNNTSSSVTVTRKSPAGGKLPTLANQLKDTENERPKSTLPSVGATTTSAVKPNNRLAIRVDLKTEQRTEEAVEKIVAKRFNPRRKTHEYLVKWVDRSHHENTWEVMANLERVPYFLQMFEKQLARQKLTREKGMDALKRLQQPSSTKVESPSPVSPSGQGSPPSRPSRTSKTKAMDAFKQWVNEGGANEEGSTSSPSSANEEESATEQEWPAASSPSPSSTALKRKLNHTDSSLESSGLGLGEDLEEDLIPSHTVKRLKNGGSSVQLNKPRALLTQEKSSPQLAKINGNTSSSAAPVPASAEHKMGEIIFTEDSTSSGMFRKPEMPNTIQVKKDKVQSPVRYLSRSEMASNSRGIYRVEQQPAEAAVTPKVSPGLPGLAKRNPPARASPLTVGQRQQVLRPAGQQQTTPQQRRPLAAQSSTPQFRQQQQQTPLRNQTVQQAGGGRILARPGAAGNTQQTRPAVGTKVVTPEQKILQLSKSGDLKVTRKVVTREEVIAQRASQARQQQQQQQVKIQQVQQIRGSAAKLQSTPQHRQPQTQPLLKLDLEEEQEQEEAPEEVQLCPITGKLIGQEETQLQMEQEQQQEQQREQLEAAAQALLGSDQQVLTNEDGSALLVRGEDGTVYQVAGKTAEGQTILVTQGPDGEQQFAYVAAAGGDDTDVLSLDHAVAEAVQGAGAGTQTAAATSDGEQILVSMTEEELAQHQAAVLQQQVESGGAAGTPATAQIHITTSDSDGTEAQIPAEVVQADLPSPGGTRRVVLLLQDGTFMMTEMHEEQFKTLNIPT